MTAEITHLEEEIITRVKQKGKINRTRHQYVRELSDVLKMSYTPRWQDSVIGHGSDEQHTLTLEEMTPEGRVVHAYDFSRHSLLKTLDFGLGVSRERSDDVEVLHHRLDQCLQNYT